MLGVSYKNDNTDVLMDRLNRQLEFRLYDDQRVLQYRYVIKRKDMKKIKISPNTIEIDFKVLHVMHKDSE